jgi:hypothetical protein
MAIVVIGIAGLFFLKRPDGRPWLSVQDFVPNADQISEQVKNAWPNTNDANNAATSASDAELAPGVSKVNSGGTTVYRWRDEFDNWVYSDTPPTAQQLGNRQAETVTIAPNPNVMPSNNSTANPLPATPDTAQSTGFKVPLPLTVSPSDASKLVDDAKAVQELLKQRQENMESMESGQSR